MDNSISSSERFILGTVQFGLNYGISNDKGRTTKMEIDNILSKSLQFGIDMLDTANAYGESEKAIGKSISRSFKIISKFPGSVKCSDDIKASLNESLLNLNVERLYGYLAHDANVLLCNPDLWLDLQRFQEIGKVSKIGYSLYYPEQLVSLLEAGYQPDIVQIPYSFVDRRFAKYFTRLKDIGCEIHVRSIFLQGLFFVAPEKLVDFFNPIKPLLRAVRKNFVDSDQIAAFFMNFVLATPEIDRIVFGVNSEVQLIENINASTRKFIPFTFEGLNVPEEILLPFKWPSQL